MTTILKPQTSTAYRAARPIFAVGLFPALVTAAAWAEEMPESAPDDLQRILAAKEYQPRSQPEGLLSKLWNVYGAQAIERVRSAFRWVRERMPEVEPPEWLESLGRIIHDAFLSVVGFFRGLVVPEILFPLLLLLLVGGAVWFNREALLRLLRDFLRDFRGDPEPPQGAEEEMPIPLDALAAQGEARALLEGIRIALRRDLRERYGVTFSISDRDVLRRVPRADARRGIFEDCATLFERWSFAKAPVEAAQALSLYERLRTLSERGEA